MDLKIESRNVGMTPRWKTEIEERVAALGTETFRPTHARVTLTKNNHHKKGADNCEALVVVTVPRKHTITSRKHAKTFEEAIRAALTAVETELRKMQEKRSLIDNREPNVPLRGVVSKLFPLEGYGFILQEGGGDVYFHRNAVHGVSFEDLEDGDEVAFNVEPGEKGPQATTVNPAPILP